MKRNREFPLVPWTPRHLLAFFVFAAFVLVMAVPSLHADPVFWTGPTIDYLEQNPGDADVLVPGEISLARGFGHPLYNPAAGEFGPDDVISPTNTTWAFGDIADFASLTFVSFSSLRAEGPISELVAPPDAPHPPMVVHLLTADVDIYLSLTFVSWTQSGPGFEYIRSTPAVVVGPTVNITSPTNGATFAAPASIHLTASASGGTVTNVQYFAGATSLGSATAAPFSVTGSPLAAGNYGITAVATAAGVNTTSAVVNVTVVAPAAVSLSSPHVRSNQFIFSYAANPGLSYVIQSSTNLKTWLPLVTNIAASNPVLFTNTFSLNSNIYYRVGRLPNP